ncbi:hypothetical protein ASA1KI_15530 [Opitutales bacterium ASA1]|uniref:Type 1 glutamine amidotransferase-like domain-containing protein n=1 Tax=Congregicoccus parvus TaxID=3081749 RepID=UPI002B2D9A0D|nr:hypothetical protein ASA1KI_15530 [Opitutales bacterium ASA1]
MNRRAFLTALALTSVSTLRLHGATPSTATRVRLLLLGASTPPGGVFLRHAIPHFAKLYPRGARILVVADAAHPDDRDRQAARIASVLREACEAVCEPLHSMDESSSAEFLDSADGLFVGGGDTFLLLRSLYDRDLVGRLRARILAGLPYAGSSAGSNIAGPVIGTTNDFPVVDVPTRRALGVFPALINPHHPESDEPEFVGRAGKIRGYLRLNPDERVVGLPERSIVGRFGGRTSMVAGPAWVYQGGESTAVKEGDDITALVG